MKNSLTTRKQGHGGVHCPCINKMFLTLFACCGKRLKGPKSIRVVIHIAYLMEGQFTSDKGRILRLDAGTMAALVICSM